MSVVRQSVRRSAWRSIIRNAELRSQNAEVKPRSTGFLHDEVINVTDWQSEVHYCLNMVDSSVSVLPIPTFDLKMRTREFAVQIVKLFRTLPRSEEARVVGKQML